MLHCNGYSNLVLCNATIITQKKINELDRAMNKLDRAMNETKELVELVIKRGKNREQELKLQLEKERRERKKENFFS